MSARIEMDIYMELMDLQSRAVHIYDELKENQNMWLDRCKFFEYDNGRVAHVTVTIVSKEQHFPKRYPDFYFPLCECWRQRDGICEYEHSLSNVCILPKLIKKLCKKVHDFEQKTGEEIRIIDFWYDDCGPGADITLDKGFVPSFFGSMSTPFTRMRQFKKEQERKCQSIDVRTENGE
jgi:hypothetical protein